MTAYYYFGWRLARTLFNILFGFRKQGLENIPTEGGAIIAANHQSNLDPPVVGTSIKRACHFFAKKELFDNFILGPVIKGFNSIPVRRGVYDPASLDRAIEALKNGGLMIMFPEGTRNDGVSFLPAKAGIGFIARQANVPIVPAYLWGTTALGQAFKRKPPLGIIFGQSVPAATVESFENDKSGHLEVAELVMNEISKLKDRILKDAD